MHAGEQRASDSTRIPKGSHKGSPDCSEAGPGGPGVSCILACAVGVLLLLSPIHAAAQEGSLESVLASPALTLITTAESIETLTVKSLFGVDSDLEPTPSDLPGNFHVLDDPVPVSRELAQELAALLLSPESYAGSNTLCIFEPALAFRFRKGSEALDVIICFTCADLAFQKTGSPHALGPKLNFNPAYAELRALARRARPDDARLGDFE